MNVNCGATPCPVILNSTCVFYEGANLVYTGINTNDNLETALEKIDAAFQSSGLIYVFDNGIVQLPSQPVKLGGSLIENTTINSSGYLFKLTGTIESAAFRTTGGTASQFVRGDGTLGNIPIATSGTSGSSGSSGTRGTSGTTGTSVLVDQVVLLEHMVRLEHLVLLELEEPLALQGQVVLVDLMALMVAMVHQVLVA